MQNDRADDARTGPTPPATPTDAVTPARPPHAWWPWYVYVAGALVCLLSGAWFIHHVAGGTGRPTLIALSGVLAAGCLVLAAAAARHRRR